MINDGQVFLAGHVASPPALKLLANGTPTTTLRMAYTPRWQSRETGGWTDGPTSFVTVVCWRSLAGNVAMSLRKGEPILVMGRLRVRRYDDKGGTSRIAVEVEASSVGHDLTRGVAHFSRTRPPVDGKGQGSEGPVNVGPAVADPHELDDDAPAGARSPDVPGDGMLDERAVAELAREMSASLDVAAPF